MKAATLLLLALLAAASQRTAGAKKKKAQPKVVPSCETCVLAVNSIHGRMTEAMRPAGGLADASVEEAVADSLDAACDEVSPASQRRACSDQLMWQISSYVEELFLPTRYEAGNATTGFSEILETLCVNRTHLCTGLQLPADPRKVELRRRLRGPAALKSDEVPPRNHHMDATFNAQGYPRGGGGPPLPLMFSKIQSDFAANYSDFFVGLERVDSQLVEAVSDSGWANYPSDVIPTWPMLKEKKIDWLGGVLDELEKRDVQAYLYVNVQMSARIIQGGGGALGETPHYDWTYTSGNDTTGDQQSWRKMNATSCGTGFGSCAVVCFNAPGRLQQLADVTKELVRKYKPIAVVSTLFPPVPLPAFCFCLLSLARRSATTASTAQSPTARRTATRSSSRRSSQGRARCRRGGRRTTGGGR